MQLSFYLDRGNISKAGQAPIYYSITFSSSRIRKKVKTVKVDPKHWDEKNQRIKSQNKSENYNYYIEYNKILDDFEQKVKTIFRSYLLKEEIPTKADFLTKLSSNEISLVKDFTTSFDEFISTSKNSKAERTIKGYITARNYLKSFEEETGFQLKFDAINHQFFEAFRDYSFEIKKIKNNYFARLITTLKTFMRWSLDREYHKNDAFNKMKASERNIEVIYLTTDELKRLYEYDFSEDLKLDRVRDVYCFGCFTGLRYSDISSLKSINVEEEQLKLNIQKSKTIDHIVPLNKFSKEILEKYKGSINEPLPIISSQKFNKYIKICAQRASINKLTSITRYRGQEKVVIEIPKYKLISSHTARKTFISNSLILGMNEMAVRNISNHKTEKSFMKYVKIAEDFKSKEMVNTWDKI